MPNRILVIRLSSLGDVILTSPVYRALKARWPDCSISVLVKPQFAAVLQGNPHVDEVLVFRGLGDALKTVRARGFTHLLDLHANLRSWLLRRLSGVANVAAYRKHALARRLFVAFGVDSPALQKHTVARYLDALAGWGIAVSDTALALGDYGASGTAAPAANVLIVQSAFLGDSLLTLPLARDVKALMPGCRLSVLTLPKTAEVFRKSPWVDAVLLDDKRGADGGLLGPWRLARRLKDLGFDLALIPHRSLRSALVAWLAGIPRRVGFASSAGRFLLTQAVPFTWLMHDLERNLALLQPLGGARPVGSVYLERDPEASAALEERLRADGLAEGPLVGIHPGAAWATKRWLPERYAALCRELLGRGFKVVLVGGPQDAELCARLARESGAADWAGRTDLPELKALMGRLSLFVTNDSGPMHLATASGVPTLALFGPTTRELGFFPYGPGHRVLEVDLACRPCGLHGSRECPRGHFLCMRLITTEEVLRSALEMLRVPA